MKQFQEAVGKIREGVIGDVIMVKAQRHANADLPHDGTSGDWYFDVTKSGGYLIEQSVHNLDLCNWVIDLIRCGRADLEESCFTRTIRRGALFSTAGVSLTSTPTASRCLSPRMCFIPSQCPTAISTSTFTVPRAAWI